MTATSYVFGILAAVATIVVVVQMLRHRRLRERHAVWWLFGGLLALIVGIFPGLLDWAARLIGVSDPTNLVFFVSIAILVLVCIQLSSELTRHETQIRTLAEDIALLDERIGELERPESGRADRNPPPPHDETITS